MIDAAAPAPPQRLHPYALVIGVGRAIRGAWGLLAGGAILAFRDQTTLALLLIGTLFVFSLVGRFIDWWRFEYRVLERELRVDRGLLARSSRVIPFDRITDIDIAQGPIQRLIGVAKVRVETGSGAGDEATFDALSLARAQALRAQVRIARETPARSTAPDLAAVEPGEPLFAMSVRRVFVLGLFNFSLAVIAALFGMSQTIGDVIGLDPFSRGFWQSLADRAPGIAPALVDHRLLAIVAGCAMLGAIGVATGIVRTMLREYGFRLDSTPTGFRRRRGLLTRSDVSIATARVEASILGSGPARRAFGWHSLRLLSLASDSSGGDHSVAPLARFEEARHIQSAMARPLAPSPSAPWEPLSRGYLWSALASAAVIGVTVVVVAVIVDPRLSAALAALALFVGARWLGWRQSRFALDGEFLYLQGGWWQMERAIVPVERIQSIDLGETSWTRLFGYCRMRLGIAGARTLDSFAIAALDRASAEALRERLAAA